VKRTTGKIVFDTINYIILTCFCLVIIIPFMHIISISVSEGQAVNANIVGIFPVGFSLYAYREVLFDGIFGRALFNTVFIVCVSTFLGVLLNLSAGYVFTKKFYGRDVIAYLYVFTMFFSGGLIPFYLLITKYLHWFNTYYSLIIPGLTSFFYIIILRSQIQAIPAELTEAAIIDGASEFQVLYKIIIPAISPTIAAVSMFIALAKWNSWFDVMIFTNTRSLWTLQYYLRAMVIEKAMDMRGYAHARGSVDVLEAAKTSSKNYEMAAIVLVSLPIISVYPFVQKYFVKGILVGAVKG